MIKKSFKITALSPILITGEQNNQNNVSTLDYIPGRVLLGFYATKFIKDKDLKEMAHLDDNFYSLFLSDQVIFSNAYITDENNRKYIPAPISLEKEKYNNDIYDFLILDDEDFPEEPTKKIGGYVYFSESEIYNKEVEKIYNFHHERDRNTGSTKEGMIFNYEAIAEGQNFLGEILYSKEFAEIIEPFLKNETIYIGRSRNAQYGKVKIEFIDNNNEFETENHDKITLTFLSDTIILYENGNPSLNVDNLSKKLGVNILKSFVKSTRIETYNARWRFKTPSINAFSAGSCFLLDQLPENYEKIEITGIGENRNQGFGKVIFGLQKEENFILRENEKVTIYKPDGEIPEITKKIVQKLIEDKMVENIRIKAIEDAENFNKNLISSSLAGKLQLFVKQSNNFNEFKDKMGKLKHIAKDKLHKCNNGRKHLSEYLENEKKLFEDQQNYFGKERLQEFDFIIKKNLLFKEYYKEFFITLRKMNKLEKGESK